LVFCGSGEFFGLCWWIIFLLPLFLSKLTSIYSNNEECEYTYMNFQFFSTVRL
jgi:hypothetical protein